MDRVKKGGAIGPVELIVQTCPEENGAAALAMVLSYYGKPAPMRELTEHTIASAADLVSAARSRGIYAQGYQMTFAQLCQAPLPLIVHWKFRCFVVVTGIRGGRVYLNSPEEGCQVLSRKAFEEGFTGVAVCFADSGTEGQRSGDGSARLALPGGAALPVLLAAAQLFLAAGYLALAVLFRSVASRLSAPQTEGELMLCLELGLVILLQSGAVFFQLVLLRRSMALCHRDRVRIFRERLEQADIAFFQRTDSFRLDEAVRGCAGEPAARARGVMCVTQLISGVVCLGFMAAQVPAAAVASAVTVIAFTVACLLRRDRLYSDGKLDARAKLLTGELAAGDLETLEAARLRGEDSAHFQRWAGEAGSASRPAEREWQRLLWYGTAAVELLLVFFACLMEMIAGNAGTADVLGCLSLAAAAAISLGAVPCLLEAKAEERRHRESMNLVFSEREEDQAPSGMGAARSLTLQNAALRTGQDNAISVKDISFTVERGEILVVFGEEAVRSALAAVVSGLERPAQGELYLDRRNAAELSDREICGTITLLGGGLPFPRGTVRENIASGFQGITDYAVMEAASDALLHQSVLLRSGRYDTPVSTLSEGERVQLEFARAFARGTPFLVCNDLTGILDPETEDQLIRSLRRRGVGAVLLTGDRTLLRKGDIACRIEDGRTALRERTEIVEEEVYGLV